MREQSDTLNSFELRPLAILEAPIDTSTTSPSPYDVLFAGGNMNKEHFERYESLGRGMKIRLVEAIMKVVIDQIAVGSCNHQTLKLANGSNSRMLEVPENEYQSAFETIDDKQIRRSHLQ